MMKKLEVSARLVEDFKIVSKIRDHQVIVDQPPLGGGKNEGPSPLEFACLSLAACVITVGQIIARQKRIVLRNLEARVEAEIDPDVYMGKNKELRPGFIFYKVFTKIDADLSSEEKKAFLKEIDSRCPVSENLQNVTPVHLEIEE
ncbi:putative redox protein [Gammaproteobacteria bacterium]